jgi:hypothetical protein
LRTSEKVKWGLTPPSGVSGTFIRFRCLNLKLRV